MVAAKLATLKQGQIGRGRTADLQTYGSTADQAAKMLNVGERTVFSAKTILRDGTPEEIETIQTREAAEAFQEQFGGEIFVIEQKG